MDGLLVVDKPAGVTSHDVVDEVRRRLGTKKVGHGGTLDPDATGILLVGVGRATRFLAYSQGAPKGYAAVALFGVTTTTQDASGEVVERRPATFGGDDLREVAAAFTGKIEQIPPMMSAVKIGGERLYAKARRGEEVERRPRQVTIYRLDVTEFDPSGPRATMKVRCSAGTYVRTLVHDIGQRLGCGAHLETLRRDEAGGFTMSDAIALDEVGEDRLRPLRDAVRALPAISVDRDAARLVGHGRALAATDDGLEEGTRVAVCSEERLLGVYRRQGSHLLPERVVGA